MKIKLLLIILIMFTPYTEAKVKSTKMYYRFIFGHLHQGPSFDSLVLTTLACGHPVLWFGQMDAEKSWALIQTSGHKAYLPFSSLSLTRPECLQTRYPYFFESLKMEVSDFYSWGQLYDHYLQGHTNPESLELKP